MNVQHIDVMSALRLRHIEREERPLREQYTEVTVPLDVYLGIAAKILEVRRAMAGVAEAVHLLKVKNHEVLKTRVGEVHRLATRLVRMDLTKTLQQVPWSKPSHDPSGDFPANWFDVHLRSAASFLAACPIDDLVQHALEAGLEKDGHRCRQSFDWLEAFVRRNRYIQSAASTVIGRAYAEGRLSIEEVSSLLSMQPPDAVAWLQDNGYARDIDMIRLSDGQRNERLAQLREARLASSKPIVEAALVRAATRDTLASQRIEDIDAGRWFAACAAE